jgi:hypothetical protein
VQWGNALIVNVLEEMQTDQMALELGIIDKATVASRYEDRYGKTWEEIEAAIQEEQANANQGNADIGAMILRNFNNGMGAEQGGQQSMMGQGQNNQAAEMGGNNRAA